MEKRAKILEEQEKRRRLLKNSPSRTLSGIPVSTSQLIESTAVSHSGEEFSSEEQALECLVGSIVEKLGDKTQEKAELADFLNLLIETDPSLREEILAGVSIKRA